MHNPHATGLSVRKDCNGEAAVCYEVMQRNRKSAPFLVCNERHLQGAKESNPYIDLRLERVGLDANVELLLAWLNEKSLPNVQRAFPTMKRLCSIIRLGLLAMKRTRVIARSTEHGTEIEVNNDK